MDCLNTELINCPDDELIDIFFPKKIIGQTITICIKQYDGTEDNITCSFNSTICEIANILIYRPNYKKYQKTNNRMSFNIGGKLYKGSDDIKINTIPYIEDLIFHVSVHL